MYFKITHFHFWKSIDCLGKFDINPKVTSTDNLGCKYCKYHDVCFMKKQDEVLIDVPSDLSFLGGDINA